MISNCRRAAIVTLIAMPVALVAVTPTTAGSLLGRLDFPNSGAPEAQADFLEGVLYLHNFEYEDARDAFVRARETDPDFALAYWGEAMTHNHPIWMEQETDEGRDALERLGATPELRQARAGTAREAAYLETVETLFGLTAATAELEKEARDLRYRDAMASLSEAYPDDDEARVFHALSILGSAHDGRDFATYMRAAAVAFEVWNRNDRHPGAAHYLIHSFDDPIHAPLGLPMAEVYAEIAPAAAHAQHMTSHIFVALGRWRDVIDANIVARDVQNAGFEERGRPPRLCGHYPYWLQYGLLQSGRLAEAEEVLDRCRESVDGAEDEGVRWHYLTMSARHVIDAEAWTRDDGWPREVDAETPGSVNWQAARGLAAFHRGDGPELRDALEVVRAVPEGAGRYGDFGGIVEAQLDGLVLLESEPEAGLERLRQAVEAEESLAHMFGPPAVVKPSLELLAERLLDAGRFEEARAAFDRQLDRTPGRTTALLGLARAAERGQQWDLARRTYGRLARHWAEADEGLAAVEEASVGAEAR